ncbi:ABC-2 transporter permease [Leucobacter celer]|uniref:ABC transporter permease subunit n=1 Tax=Leucobacter celer TaxID=668625 RepID=UPI0006A7A8F1|nr:ABC transporter permease subunit [Leucobacter celer]
MNSTIIIDASRAPEPASPASSGSPARGARPAAPAHRLTFSGVLRSERIKLTSLRSIRLTLLITVLFGLGLSAMIALLWSRDIGGEGAMISSDPAGLQTYLLIVSTFTAPFLALVFGVLGVFAISSEYSSGMILSTLTAVPRRSPVFAAKALVTAGIAAATALILVLGGLGIAVAFLPEAAAQIVSTAVISGALGTVAYLVLIALLAFGIAGLLRSTAGGIAVVAGLTFVLPIAFQLLTLTGWEWVPTVSAYLPAELGSTLSQGVSESTLAEAATIEGAAAPAGPDYWLALVSMVGWSAIAVAPAALAFQRRDAR